MTGVELILLLAGSVFMVGSFFVTEKLSAGELSKLAELSEEELHKIIDRGLKQAESRIDDAINAHIEASADRVDRALEKETNEKIMAISEYSDTVVEGMNKTHNEIMFLYSMLNDKHTELTGMVSDMQKLAADVRSMQETMESSSARMMPQKKPVPPVRNAVPVRNIPPTARTQEKASAQTTQEAQPQVAAATTQAAAQPQAQAQTTRKQEKANASEILALHKSGLNEIQIARKLGLGIGEVRLVIGLYRGEKNS